MQKQQTEALEQKITGKKKDYDQLIKMVNFELGRS